MLEAIAPFTTMSELILSVGTAPVRIRHGQCAPTDKRESLDAANSVLPNNNKAMQQAIY